MDVIRHYDTLSALVTQAGSTKPVCGERDDDWAGCDFDTAIKLATYGWHKGVQKAREIVEKISNRLIGRTALGAVLEIDYDVMGAAFDAGAVALGIPEAWGVLQPQVSKRAVRIVANISVSAGVPAESIRTRGYAVTAIALALQARGYPVTVDVIWSSRHYDESQFTITCRVADASIGSQLDVDRLTYALAHPSMARWLIRNIVDQPHGKDAWGPSRPQSNNKPTGQIDIFTGGQHLHQVERWKDGGEQWILDEYNKQTGG